MPENIELQELLNRKTGPGRISPQTPLEVRLYGSDGQPLGTQSNPLEVRVRELEAELQELRQTLTSGDAKTQLTGQITSIIKHHDAVPVDELDFATYGTVHFGDTIGRSGSGVRYLDVADYPHVDILVANQTDVPLNLSVRIYPFGGVNELESLGHSFFRNTVITGIYVPNEGSRPQGVWLRSIEYPELNRLRGVMASLSVVGDMYPSSGSITVMFLGSRI